MVGGYMVRSQGGTVWPFQHAEHYRRPLSDPLAGCQHTQHRLGPLGVGCFWTAIPKAGLRAFGADPGML
jgi:hypothetical protein